MAMYADEQPETAAQTARQLGIDYIFIGPAEVKANRPDRLAKFDTRPELFRKVFANTSTRIYEVLGVAMIDGGARRRLACVPQTGHLSRGARRFVRSERHAASVPGRA